MERPFKEQRPLGPFAQSDGFSRKFGLRTTDEEHFSEGDEGAAYVTFVDPDVSNNELFGRVSEFIEVEVDDFINFDPHHAGLIGGLSTRGTDEFEAYVITYTVLEVHDADLTVSQMEDALHSFLEKNRVPVNDVTIYNNGGS